MVFDEGGAPTLEGGHSARRVLHAGGDATGLAILRALLASTREDRRIQWMEARAASLLVDDGRVRAVRAEGAGGEVEADRTILATGGGTGIFGRRTGPERATGQGMAMAWDAGAALADLEFVQFHPTALDVPGQPSSLLTEALRGEGAVLLDADGERFMPRFDPRAELAPRDVVARAIAEIREATGRQVFLDGTRVPSVRERFPTAAASCAKAGLNLGRDRIPVAPAAHYFMGGVFTDASGRTTVPGLSACGEVACTRVHGANRLASNSLLEALVFGRRAALAGEGRGPSVLADGRLPGWPPGELALKEVRNLADRFLGVSRTGSELDAASAKLAGGGELEGDRSATLIAWLLACAALRREESRGGHFRRDFLVPDDHWRLHQAVSLQGWTTIPLATIGRGVHR